MSTSLRVAREILEQLLSTAPMKGALLKPHLFRQFESRTGLSFAREFFQYPKFSQFLRANSDVVEVLLPQGPGDILVRLRRRKGDGPAVEDSTTDEGLMLDTLAVREPASSSELRYLEAPLWHAFSNPDPLRRRFYHRVTREVAHFVEGESTGFNAAIAARIAGDPDFVEIVPISAAEQASWMVAFLKDRQIGGPKLDFLSNLASLPYSSQTNKAFSAALEDYADAWRKFRTEKVFEKALDWSKAHDVTLYGLSREHSEFTERSVTISPRAPFGQSTPPNQDADLRQMLHAAIDGLNTKELSQILLPGSVLLKIANSRRN